MPPILDTCVLSATNLLFRAIYIRLAQVIKLLLSRQICSKIYFTYITSNGQSVANSKACSISNNLLPPLWTKSARHAT